MAYRKWEPGDFTDAVVEELLEKLADGQFMTVICSDKRMPSRETIRRWAERDDELGASIARAREVGYITRAERAVEAAQSADDAQLGRLALDAERWILGKMSRTLADKTVVQGEIGHNHSGTVKVDAADSFGRLAGALERAATAIASGARSTVFVDNEGEAGTTDAAG